MAKEKIVTNLRELAIRMAVPLAIVDKMVSNGLPQRADGSWDVDEALVFRDRLLTGITVNEGKRSGLESFRLQRADIYADEIREDLKLQRAIRREKFNLKMIKEMDEKTAIQAFDALRKDLAEKATLEKLERGESTENIALIVKMKGEARKLLRGRVGQEDGRRVEE